MKLLIKKDKTSKLLRVFIQDSSVSTGAGLTGLVYNSASLTAYYIREGAASPTSITLATMTVGTWASGGFKEVDATNMPGLYELGIPNAVLATGADSVVVMLKGATNMAPVVIEIQLVDFDPQDSVRLGLTALPNAAAEAAGGLYTRGSGTGQINQGTGGKVDVNLVNWNGTAVATPDTAGYPKVTIKSGTGTGEVNFATPGYPDVNLKYILGGLLTEASGGNILGAFKKFFDKSSPTGTVNSIPDAVAGASGGLLIAGSNAATTVNITGNLTGNVSGSVGSVTGNVGGNVTGSVGSLGATAKSDVNTEVVDALNVDTYAEPGQGTPAATATLAAKLNYLYKAWRNRNTQTATQWKLYADDATTVDQKAAVSDDGTTFDRGEIATGP